MPDVQPTSAATLLDVPVSLTPPPTPPEFRFGMSADIPEYARGKTAHEVLTLTKGVVESFSRIPQQVAPPAPTTQNDAPLDPEAYVTGRDVMALAERLIARQQTSAQPGVEAAASAVYGMAALRHPKEFAKYEPEIQGLLLGVSKDRWTLDNIDRIVSMVKGNHIVDYRSEWEQEFTSKLEPSMRSIGNAGTSPLAPDKSQSLESEKIPHDWKLRAQKAGLTEATIDEFCRTQDITRESFFRMLEQGKVVTEGLVA